MDLLLGSDDDDDDGGVQACNTVHEAVYFINTRSSRYRDTIHAINTTARNCQIGKCIFVFRDTWSAWY